MTTDDIMDLVAKGKGARFAHLTYMAKGTGETARHTVVLGANIANLYKRDIAKLEELQLTQPSFHPVAVAALLASRRESLTVGIGHNSAYTCEDVYSDTVIPGVRVHKASGGLQVIGLSIAKHVVQKGTYKRVAHSPATLAKMEVSKLLPSFTFRTFCLDKVSRIAANGEVLTIE